MEEIDTHYKEVLDYTNIDLLKRRIQTEVVSNYKKLLIEDIVGAYNLCKESIRETTKRIKETQEEIIATSQGSLEEIQKKEKEYASKYEATEADKKKMDSLIKQLSFMMNSRADELEKAIKSIKY